LQFVKILLKFDFSSSLLLDHFRKKQHCYRGITHLRFLLIQSSIINVNFIQVPKDSHILNKGIRVNIDSYSAFFDNFKLHETELDSLLKSKGINRTFVCGVATDVCVNYTVFDSLELGYEVSIESTDQLKQFLTSLHFHLYNVSKFILLVFK